MTCCCGHGLLEHERGRVLGLPVLRCRTCRATGHVCLTTAAVLSEDDVAHALEPPC